MTTQVIGANEALLGGVLYRVIGPIRDEVGPRYPEKIVIGDTTRDSQPNASVLSMSDWRGGIGINRLEESSGVNRAWWSTCYLRHRGSLTLPRLATITAAGPAANIGVLVEYQNEMYATFGTDVRKFDNGADSWGSSLATLPNAATDAIVARLNGTVYLIIAHDTGYTYFDGTTWTNDTEDMKYLAWWDDKVWGLDNTGRLRLATFITPGNWSDDAQLPLPDGFATDLLVGMSADGEPILYAMTRVGLFAHDWFNQRWVATKLSLPRHANNGNGTDRWRDSIYTPAGNAVYRYLDGVGTAVVTVMGPDRDDGLPSDKRGVIKQLVASHNELLAILDATIPTGGTLNLFVSEQSPTFNPSVGFSSILGWDERGWQVVWLGGSLDKAITYATVSNAYDQYRLWWAHNQRVYHMTLPVDITNPSEVTDFDYALSGSHETSWFSAGQHEVDKLALSVMLHLDGMSATETVTLSYATDLSTTWTQLGIMSSSGHHHFDLPSKVNREGVVFQWIRFKLDLARGSTTTRSPKVQAITLVYRKKLVTKHSFTLTIDLSQDYGGQTPSQMRDSLRKASESKTLLELVYRADDWNSEVVRRYFVDIHSPVGLDETGYSERGVMQMVLKEV